MKVGDLVKPGRTLLLNNARIGIIVSIEEGKPHQEALMWVMWATNPGIFTDQINRVRPDEIERFDESR